MRYSKWFLLRIFPNSQGLQTRGPNITVHISLMCRNYGDSIETKQKIKGIYIENKEYKVFQYADDTGILLDGSESSLRSTLNLLDQFSKYSGLTPNFGKT